MLFDLPPTPLPLGASAFLRVCRIEIDCLILPANWVSISWPTSRRINDSRLFLYRRHCIPLLGNRLATGLLFWRPKIGTTATSQIAGDHLGVVTQRSACSQVMPVSEAAQPRIGALKHAPGQDRLTIAEDEFAFDSLLDAAKARL